MQDMCVYRKDTGRIMYWTAKTESDLLYYSIPDGMDYLFTPKLKELTYVIDGVAVANVVEEPISFTARKFEMALEGHVDQVAAVNGSWKSITSAVAASSVTGAGMGCTPRTRPKSSRGCPLRNWRGCSSRRNTTR